MRFTVNDNVVDSSIVMTIILCVVVLACFCLSAMARPAQNLMRGTRSRAKVNFQFCLCRTFSSSYEACCSTRCAKASSRTACQVIKLLLAQHAMFLLVDKHRFFWQRFVHHCDDIVIALVSSGRDVRVCCSPVSEALAASQEAVFRQRRVRSPLGQAELHKWVTLGRRGLLTS